MQKMRRLARWLPVTLKLNLMYLRRCENGPRFETSGFPILNIPAHICCLKAHLTSASTNSWRSQYHNITSNDIHTQFLLPLVNAVVSAKHIVELARLRDLYLALK